MSAPAKPLPTYDWEPTTDFLAAKYGLPREAIVRYDVNTSPLPPDLRDVLIAPFVPVPAERLRAAGPRRGHGIRCRNG
jgi:hypothetical protein